MTHMHTNIQIPTGVDKTKIGLAGMTAFLAVAEKWDLTVQQRFTLLGTPRQTYYDWKQKAEEGTPFNLSQDTLERISYILGIYKTLHILLPDEHAANRWIHKPNSGPVFNGMTALEKMLAGHVVDLADVRRFLDGQRGAVYG